MKPLHVVETGTGRPVLLLHGWSCHGGFFKPQIDGLRDHCRLLVPDLPGHGRTGDTGPDLTIEAAADGIAALLGDRELDDVLVVGWSMGILVAYAMIARHGAGRLGGLVSVDMTPKVLNDKNWSLGLKDGLNRDRNAALLRSMAVNWRPVARRVARRIFADGGPALPDLAAFAEREIVAADPDLLLPMWGSLADQDFRSLLPDLSIPVALVYGARSHLYGPDVANWQLRALRQGRLFRFDRSGHAPHLEEPETFNAILKSLLLEIR